MMPYLLLLLLIKQMQKPSEPILLDSKSVNSLTSACHRHLVRKQVCMGAEVVRKDPHLWTMAHPLEKDLLRLWIQLLYSLGTLRPDPWVVCSPEQKHWL